MTANGRTPQEVQFEGELDIATTPRLRSLLTGCDADRDLLIDLGQVTFLDSAFLSELIAAHHRHTAQGSRIVVVGAVRNVRRVLAVTGLDSVIPQAATTTLALQLLHGTRSPGTTAGESVGHG